MLTQRERSSLGIVGSSLQHCCMWCCFFASSVLSKKRDIEEGRELKLGQRNGGRTDRQTRRATMRKKEGSEGEKEKGESRRRQGGRAEQKRKFGEDREKGGTMRVGKCHHFLGACFVAVVLRHVHMTSAREGSNF